MFGKKDSANPDPPTSNDALQQIAEYRSNQIAAGKLAGGSIGLGDGYLDIKDPSGKHVSYLSKVSILEELRILGIDQKSDSLAVYILSDEIELAAFLTPRICGTLFNLGFVEFGPNGNSLISSFLNQEGPRVKGYDPRELEGSWPDELLYSNARTTALRKYIDTNPFYQNIPEGNSAFISYENGLDLIDSFINYKLEPLPMIAVIDEEAGLLKISKADYVPSLLGSRNMQIAIPLEKILFASLLPISEEYITSYQVQKSVFGRAAVGGLLFGGAGAIVGAMSAATPQTTEKKETRVYYRLLIAYEDSAHESPAVLSFSTDYIDPLTGQPDKSIHQFARKLQLLSPYANETEAAISYSFVL